MPPHLARGNASRARVRVAIEHVFAAQKCRRGLIVCAVGLARATARLGLANLVTNMPRLAWFATRAAPASAAGGPKAGLAQSPAHRSSTDHRRGSTLTEILHSRSPHNPVLRGVRLSRRHLAPNPYRQGDPPDSRERRHSQHLKVAACGLWCDQRAAHCTHEALEPGLRAADPSQRAKASSRNPGCGSRSDPCGLSGMWDAAGRGSDRRRTTPDCYLFARTSSNSRSQWPARVDQWYSGLVEVAKDRAEISASNAGSP